MNGADVGAGPHVVRLLGAGVDRGGTAGFIALLLIVLLFVATVLLVRNMSARLKRLPKEFPPPASHPVRRGTPASPDGPPEV